MCQLPSSEACNSKLAMFLQTTVSLKEVFRPDAEICGHLFEPSWSAEGLENRAAEQEG